MVKNVKIFEEWWLKQGISNADTTPILKAALKDLCFKA